MDSAFIVAFLTVFHAMLLESVPNAATLVPSITLAPNVFSVTLVVQYVLITEFVKYVQIKLKNQI